MKEIKFGDIIKFLDPLSKVILWVNSENENLNEDEPAFDGYIMDIPWIFLDYLIKDKVDYEIRVATHSKEKPEPTFVINLWEAEEE